MELPKQNCVHCPNGNCFVKQYCSPEWINIINSNKNQNSYRKGRHIIIEGNPVFGIYFVMSGKVKVFSTGLGGKEQIVRLANDGHILGHRGYGLETYPISAAAIDESHLCFVDNETLYDAFIANPEFTFNLMMFYSRELRKAEMRIKQLAMMNTREKVAEALVYLLDTFGLKTKEKTLNVSLTRREIAEIAGTTAEQVSREISAMKKEKVISTDGKKIKIDQPGKLRNIIKQFNTFNS